MKNNALSKLLHVVDFKTRKLLAEGLMMSTVAYMIQVNRRCSNYLFNMLQVQQNLAARYTTKLPRLTPTNVLLSQCGWLSIRQLIQYHSLILLHKAITEKTPQYISDKLKFVSRVSRTTDHLTLIDTQRRRTVTATNGFMSKTIRDWNLLPHTIRELKKSVQFKNQLKTHISHNVPAK